MHSVEFCSVEITANQILLTFMALCIQRVSVNSNWIHNVKRTRHWRRQRCPLYIGYNGYLPCYTARWLIQNMKVFLEIVSWWTLNRNLTDLCIGIYPVGPICIANQITNIAYLYLIRWLTYTILTLWLTESKTWQRNPILVGYRIIRQFADFGQFTTKVTLYWFCIKNILEFWNVIYRFLIEYRKLTTRLAEIIH